MYSGKHYKKHIMKVIQKMKTHKADEEFTMRSVWRLCQVFSFVRIRSTLSKQAEDEQMFAAVLPISDVPCFGFEEWS